MTASVTELDRKRRIDALRASIAAKLNEIAAAYSDPVKITLVVRVPGYPDGRRDTVMTDDDPELTIAALRSLYRDPKSERYGDLSDTDAIKIGRGLLHD